VPHPDDDPQRGEIYWVDWSPGRGSEQTGRRPSLVISLDSFNRRMPTIVVAALTTAVRESTRQGRSPVSVYLPAGHPLPHEGSVLAFQVSTIAKERLEDYAGDLSANQMLAVDAAIRTSFGI
jgi:mRNA interferase MazF